MHPFRKTIYIRPLEGLRKARKLVVVQVTSPAGLVSRQTFSLPAGARSYAVSCDYGQVIESWVCYVTQAADGVDVYSGKSPTVTLAAPAAPPPSDLPTPSLEVCDDDNFGTSPSTDKPPVDFV